MSQVGDVFEGKTLDAAVRNGLEALGLSRAQVVITILEEGSSGFLGIGARPFRVRVMRRIGGPPEVESDAESRRRRHEGRERRRRNGRDRGERRGPAREFGGPEGGRSAGPERREEHRRERPGERGEGRREPRGERGAPGRPQGGGFPEAGRGQVTDRREERREGRRDERREGRREGYRDERREGRRDERREGFREDRGGDREEAIAAEGQGETPLSSPESGGLDEGHRRRRRGRRGGRRRQGVPGEGVGPQAFAQEEPEESHAGEPGPAEFAERGPEPAPPAAPAAAAGATSFSGEELAAQSRRLTEALLTAMGFEATVTATVDGNHVEVTAEVAKDEDLLTGRKGEVRQALQHLLNRMLNRGESSRFHLQLEINDFWKRREEELRELARGLADEAVSSGGEAVTEYLNAQERRIVHVTLREDARVKTYALGTGMIKRVAIAPADYEGGSREEGE